MQLDGLAGLTNNVNLSIDKPDFDLVVSRSKGSKDAAFRLVNAFFKLETFFKRCANNLLAFVKL